MAIKKKVKLKFFSLVSYIYKSSMYPYIIRYFGSSNPVKRVNLCCGSQKIPGYCGIDIALDADIIMDLSKKDLPFKPSSLDAIVCVSAINYFTKMRAEQLIKQTYSILKPGGIVRFSVQDLESLAKRYVEKDNAFFFEKLPNGSERFEGATIGDKFASWFYGYVTQGGFCKYVYDYESLSYLFRRAGFSIVEKRNYLDSRLGHIDCIDNRPEQI